MTQRTGYRYILVLDGIDRGRSSLKFVRVQISGSNLPSSPSRRTRIQAKTTPETARQVESGTGMSIFSPKLLSV